MDAFKAEAIRLALRKMFRASGWFDITTVRRCLETAHIVAPREEVEALEPLHCVHWSEMTPEMRAEVQRRTLALFSHPDVDLEDLEAPLLGDAPQASTGIFRRLLGKGAADA